MVTSFLIDEINKTMSGEFWDSRLFHALEESDRIAFDNFISGLLQSSENRRKEKVYNILTDIDLKKDSDSLIKLLNDPHSNKIKIIDELAKRKYKKAIEPITNFVFSTHENLRKKAAHTLYDEFGVKKWANLVNGLTNDYLGLAATGDLRAAPMLKTLIESNTYSGCIKKKFALALIKLVKKHKNLELIDDKLKKDILTPHTDSVIGRETYHSDVKEASSCKHGVGHGDHIGIKSSGTHTDIGIGLDMDDF